MNTFKNLKTDNFTQIFNNIHAEVKQKMQQNTKVEQAKQIQNILKQIKHTISLLRDDTSSAILNTVNNEIVELINETFQQQRFKHSSLTSSSALFRRSHKIKAITGYDDIFEEQLNYLLKAAANMKGIDVNIPLGSGQDRATSSALNNLSKEVQKKILNITKEAAQNLNISVNQQKNVVGESIVRTAGKVDLKTPYFNVIGDSDNIINRLLKVFSNGTFTLKNYASYTSKLRSLDQIDIHLGNTNLYKSITGGLSQVLLDVSDQNTVYYRGMTILSGHSENPDTADIETINSHFAHLRFMYELRGTGLMSSNGNSQVADFIIWNDPSSENIVVRSTKDLVAKYIDNYKNAFSAISLSASALSI